MAIKRMTELAAQPDQFLKKMAAQLEKAPASKKQVFINLIQIFSDVRTVVEKLGFKFDGNTGTTFEFRKQPGDEKDQATVVKALSTKFKAAFRLVPTSSNGYWLVKDMNGVKMQVSVYLTSSYDGKGNPVNPRVVVYGKPHTEVQKKGFLVDSPKWK